MKSNKKLIYYFLITFAFSWILWLPFVLTGFGVYEMTDTLEGLLMPAIMIGAFGPMVSAIILIKKYDKELGIKGFFKENLNFRIKPIYYVLAILVPFAIVIVAHYVTNGFGIDTLPENLFPEGLNVSPIILVVPYFLLMLILGGGQEEFGWRGYAQEPMQNQFGVIKGSIIIGFLWGLWHAPLWFIPGEGHEYYSFLAFVLFTTSFALIIGIFYNISGKKMVIPWFIHAASNTAIPFFPVLFLVDVPQPGYWVFVIVNILVAVSMTIWYHKKHLNKTNHSI